MIAEERLSVLPDNPGVYLFKDAAGDIIYVGKAASLRHRVRSYFQASRPTDAKTQALLEHVADLDYIITDNELEAIILEATLARRHQPRYNILLKDDKHLPYLRLDAGEDFPRLTVARRVEADGARYFGPYHPASALRETLRLARALFPLRSCAKLEGRPRACLNHHIGRCPAPCQGLVTPEAYGAMVRDLIAFLDGRYAQLIRGLEGKMAAAAEGLAFEEAARLRDRIGAVRSVAERQKAAFPGLEDMDAVGMARAGEEAELQVFSVRGGKLVGREAYVVAAGGAANGDLLRAALLAFYAGRDDIPATVLLPAAAAEGRLLEAWLRARRGKRVRLVEPHRGERAQLLKLAQANAVQRLEERRNEAMRAEAIGRTALFQLQHVLGLEAPPERIEGYDVSDLGGTDAVAVLVAFRQGLPDRTAYRRFKLRRSGTADDFAAMAEVISRRFRRVAAGERDLPELVLVDGGKGQVGAAVAALAGLGLAGIPVAGLAKAAEHVFMADTPHPIVLPRNSEALQLLQRVRDEAHRFAVTYHRRVRGKRALRSSLDDIPGVGPARRTALLRRFGSLAALRRASAEDIAAVPGIGGKLAATILAHLTAKESDRHVNGDS
ncbi:MAG: excinuclease ABC subunit UvrC [Bacillota bacterium]